MSVSPAPKRLQCGILPWHHWNELHRVEMGSFVRVLRTRDRLCENRTVMSEFRSYLAVSSPSSSVDRVLSAQKATHACFIFITLGDFS